ncbi:hypothetical protein K2173_007034 [Erythroxylum novogranatense]|uniref:Uncharacterized protein n=1 Tax=Erythroxylum novogranatense TaxID=1862640 RepID=A0AAV8SL06_9ROSI|nr:hypothetical protein K2173_007034 [Erythroxylum novogranatense]
MPGNEVGDRIHNFFGQEKFSQGQHHSQVIDGSWSGLSNSLWTGNHRQIGTTHISNLKNHNIQPSADYERGHGSQPSIMQHGIDFSPATLQPEFARSQSQNQETMLNGFMHGHQVFTSRQNDANFLGMETETDRHNLTSRGVSILDSQVGNGYGLNQKNTRVDSSESPVNFDFFGGQQQMNDHHPGMQQSSPKQHPSMNDMQLLQQQYLFKQMQEIQRQQHQLQKQQLQRQETRQLNSVNAQQAASNDSQALINGIPVHDTSNYSWHPELMTGSPNWHHRGVPPVLQASSSGSVFPLEHGQASRLMGMVPQQVDQSLYGVPISGTRVTPSHFSTLQTEKTTMQQISSSSNSSPANPYSGFSEQVGTQEGNSLFRQGYQGRGMIGSAGNQGVNSGFSLESLQKINAHQSNGLMPDFLGRQEVVGPLGMLEEKTMTQVPPSKTVSTLDPTEEKILFGSDDNLWEAFGKGANVGSGGNNMFDGSDCFSTFPSLQSGSWSALMQSAVAETSSADAGLQEEWSGVAFRSNQPPDGTQQMPAANNSNKHHSFQWASNGLQTAPVLNSSGLSPSGDSNNGVQQLGVKTSPEQNNRLQNISSQKFTAQVPVEGLKWSDPGLLHQEIDVGNNAYENGSHSSDVKSKVNNFPGSWTGHGTPPYIVDQQSDRPSSWNYNNSVSFSSGVAIKDPHTESLAQTSQSTDEKSSVYGARGHIGSPQVNRENSNHSQVAAVPYSGTIKPNRESSQQLSNSNSIDVWKHFDSSVNAKVNEIPRKYQAHMDKTRPTLHSFGNNNLQNGAVEAHDSQNVNTMENATNKFENMSHQTSSAGGRENSWFNANDSGTFPGSKQKSSSHVARKPSGIRKFQYHPMGDLEVDIDPSQEARNTVHSQSVHEVSQGLKAQDLGYIGRSNFPSHLARNSMGHSTSFHEENAVNKTATSSQTMLELLQKVDQAREHGNVMRPSSSNNTQSSEMPQAETSDGSLQKNQSSVSQGFGLQLAPPSHFLSHPEHALPSGNSSQTKHNQTNSIGPIIGEKNRAWLASASSVQSVPLSSETSQRELRTNMLAATGQNNKHFQKERSATFSPGFPYVRSYDENQQMDDRSGQSTYNPSVNLSIDRFTPQLKQIEKSINRAQTSEPALSSLPGTSKSTADNDIASSNEVSHLVTHNQNHASGSTQQFPVLEAAPASQQDHLSGFSLDGVPTKVSPAIWNSASLQQRPFGSQPFRLSSNMLKSNVESIDSLETTFSQPQKLEDQNAQRGGNSLTEYVGFPNSHGFVGKEQQSKGNLEQHVSPENDSGQKRISTSHGKEAVLDYSDDTPPSKPGSTQKIIEAFGQSLIPNNTLHPNYNLMHQYQGMKDSEVDPTLRSLKRFRGPDGAVDAKVVAPQGGHPLYGNHNMVGDSSASNTLNASGDSKILNFTSKPTDCCDKSESSCDVPAFGRNDPHNFVNSNVEAPFRGENSNVSPQMAPSWFDRYGTFKNGQTLSIHGAPKNASMKTAELPFPVGRPSDKLHAHGYMPQGNATADGGQYGVFQKCSNHALSVTENFTSPQLLHSEDADTGTDMLVGRLKKRKCATSGLLSWQKEVTQCLQKLHNISTAEMDWALAVNRLSEKVEEETEMLEDGVLRSRRRLILTTQLMQLLFHPPLASIMSADAVSHCESVSNFAARTTMGNACSALCTGTDTPVQSQSGNILTEKVKTSDRMSDEYSKIMEDFVSRAKKIENVVLRLDQSLSLSDLRLECQDLGKVSVINRFAKFHGRNQADVSEMSSSSAVVRKSCPQRYVTALPMPRNLPDGELFLSLRGRTNDNPSLSL